VLAKAVGRRPSEARGPPWPTIVTLSYLRPDMERKPGSDMKLRVFRNLVIHLDAKTSTEGAQSVFAVTGH
jgi:hypothetical protein